MSPPSGSNVWHLCDCQILYKLCSQTPERVTLCNTRWSHWLRMEKLVCTIHLCSKVLHARWPSDSSCWEITTWPELDANFRSCCSDYQLRLNVARGCQMWMQRSSSSWEKDSVSSRRSSSTMWTSTCRPLTFVWETTRDVSWTGGISVITRMFIYRISHLSLFL